MLSKTLQDALNKQMNSEMYSGYLYLGMAAYFNEINLSGIALWMQTQAKEELEHAMKIYKYILDREGSVDLYPLDKPATTYESPVTAFEKTYEHEKTVTGMINDLVGLALKENDHATYTFLQWFISEQVEEEATANSILQKIKLIGADNWQGLFMIDRELGMRR